mmetsp:Transcript_4698/g.13156  ORF Transcript_4698/g.13156 Transcript_4698/m.13156 type:complete len:323 (+) Transcript_4698:726-1694(+)
MGRLGCMPGGSAGRCWNCALRRSRRSSLRWAMATYSGLLPIILPFISVTARVASSGEEKATKPDPREAPAESRITRHEVIVPNSAKICLSFSSSTVSERFFRYRLAPANFSARSLRSCSNCARSWASRSAFFWARQTNHSWSPSGRPLSFSTASAACSGSSKLTNPNPRDLPASSFITTTLVVGPHSSKAARSASSVVSSERFFTYTLLKADEPVERSCLRTKGPTKMGRPATSRPLRPSMARWAASPVSNCTKPYPLDCPEPSAATLALSTVPNSAKVSCSTLLFTVRSRFFTKMFPRPLLRELGSRCEYMMRMGRPFTGV